VAVGGKKYTPPEISAVILQKMKQTVAFIGLGLMGGPMVKNVLKAGYGVRAYNRTTTKLKRPGSGCEGVRLAEWARPVRSDGRLDRNR
jgi:UDP-N-acetyl-D-mannosaminuronate dehydrogenase